MSRRDSVDEAGIAIIGAGHAGSQVAASLRQAGYDGRFICFRANPKSGVAVEVIPIVPGGCDALDISAFWCAPTCSSVGALGRRCHRQMLCWLRSSTSFSAFPRCAPHAGSRPSQRVGRSLTRKDSSWHSRVHYTRIGLPHRRRSRLLIFGVSVGHLSKANLVDLSDRKEWQFLTYDEPLWNLVVG
jgi:hypothetical protein